MLTYDQASIFVSLGKPFLQKRETVLLSDPHKLINNSAAKIGEVNFMLSHV